MKYYCRCYNEGFIVGKFEGHSSGMKEGNSLGYKQGALLAKEVKSYEGFAEFLIKSLYHSPQRFVQFPFSMIYICKIVYVIASSYCI